ncbi:MAG: TIGR01244 family sulfur transferase [Pseudomonadota bacterium]
MEIRRIADDFAVSGQIDPSHIEDLKEAGFKTIVCNRPDGEDTEQPSFEIIARAAEDAGLAFYNIPVSPSGMTYENVDATKAMLAEAEGPIFAYCRSGARSTNLWQFAQQQSGE